MRETKANYRPGEAAFHPCGHKVKDSMKKILIVGFGDVAERLVRFYGDQAEFVGLVREAVAAGTTVFLSSHVLPEVEALAGRVAVLRQGQLVTIATIDELRQRARHRLRLLVDGEADERRFLAVPGVVSVAREGPAIDVVVEGSVDGVLKVAATMTVKRISTPGDDLAEMFMAFYGGEAAQ